MKKAVGIVVALLLLAGTMVAQTTEKRLHIKIDISVPQEMIQKTLPTINRGRLQDGKIHVGPAQANGVDWGMIVMMMRNGKDNDFMTLDSGANHVRVGKVGANLVVKATNDQHAGQEAELTLPFTVLDGLLSAGKGELDLLGAIDALVTHNEAIQLGLSRGTAHIQISMDAQ